MAVLIGRIILKVSSYKMAVLIWGILKASSYKIMVLDGVL